MVDLIIDVGVGENGSPDLYRHFRTAHFVLVDPFFPEPGPGYRPEKYECHKIFADCKTGTRLVFQDHTNPELSSRFSRTHLTRRPNHRLEEVLVPADTLDRIVGNKIEKSVGLKIDTEGGELSVLEGIDNLIPSLKFIIVELSLKPRFVGGPSASEVVARLWEMGFGLSAISGLLPESDPNRMDGLFVPWVKSG